MEHKVPAPFCSHAQEDSTGEKQEPWFLHQICKGPAEPGQARVSVPQLLSPQVTRFPHRGEIPEWSTLRRWSDPADQPELNNDAPSKYSEIALKYKCVEVPLFKKHSMLWHRCVPHGLGTCLCAVQSLTKQMFVALTSKLWRRQSQQHREMKGSTEGRWIVLTSDWPSRAFEGPDSWAKHYSGGRNTWESVPYC